MPENDRPIQSESAETAARRPPPEPEPIGLTVLYEDEHLIAVDKPPGIVVHPTYKNWSGTLLNGLLWHLRESGPVGTVTSSRGSSRASTKGPLVSSSWRSRQKSTHESSATPPLGAYASSTWRSCAARRSRVRGSIALPLARSAVDRRRVVVDPSGQESRTDYELLYQSRDVSLVRCELVTGRTHQIRVHMAARGWPLVGDVVYGVPDERISRQALHAWRVTLPHPMSRQVLELEATPPADMRSLLPTDAVDRDVWSRALEPR